MGISGWNRTCDQERSSAVIVKSSAYFDLNSFDRIGGAIIVVATAIMTMI